MNEFFSCSLKISVEGELVVENFGELVHQVSNVLWKQFKIH